MSVNARFNGDVPVFICVAINSLHIQRTPVALIAVLESVYNVVFDKTL